MINDQPAAFFLNAGTPLQGLPYRPVIAAKHGGKQQGGRPNTYYDVGFPILLIP